MFEKILLQQGKALSEMMVKQPTARLDLMQQAAQQINDAIALAIQASKQVKHEDE
jgi:hypothetical protein